jgi:xanthine dehydrogenase accessory factor
MAAQTPVDLWRAIAGALDAGVACVLATLVETRGSVPRPAGAKMLVRADGAMTGTVGGGALELAVLEASREVLQAGEPRLLSYQLKPDLGMTCGGAAQVFLEPLVPADRLYIFGAGHIGQALAPLAAAIGFRVTMIDERTELCSPSLIPSASAFLHSYRAEDWHGLVFDDRTYCVVLTPSHRHDTAVVTELLRRPAAYVGMIGSKRKRATAEEALRAAGIDEARIGGLRSPIGEPIGAETPAEIAVSIAAELVRRRHERTT